MIELELLNVLKDRVSYDAYSRFVNQTSLGEESYNIFVGMGEWFKHSPKEPAIDWEHFKAWWCMVRHAKMDKTKLTIYRGIMDRLAAMAPPDPSKVKALLEGLQTRDYAARIADKALKIADGDFTVDFNAIGDMVDERNRVIGKVDKIDNNILFPSLSGLEKVGAPGLKWRLTCMNESLGDLRQGDFIILGKRPDSGGTTFLASEATFMAEQLGGEKVVLWINNEEDGNKVLRRVVQSALAWPTAKVESDLAAALEAYAKKLGKIDKIVLFNKADVHVRDVEILLEKFSPGLIVFDQLWKLHGYEREAANEVTRQTMVFNWAREVAKEHAPVITVHQADGSAEGKKWIDMSQLYGSKTGVQGEADAIVTIGRLPEEGNKRYIYVPKNKLSGGNPALRNGRFEVEIQPEIARWKEYV
jgi:hypothetical protein